MQPVNGKTTQHQTIPLQMKMPGNRTSAESADKKPLRMNTYILPVDVVTLSEERSSVLSLKKEPSTPVTYAESQALRDSFSVYA
jgi:hypothetical protein